MKKHSDILSSVFWRLEAGSGKREAENEQTTPNFSYAKTIKSYSKSVY